VPLIETIKKTVEQLTGLGRPKRRDLRSLIEDRHPLVHHFSDDGKTPNNPRLPLLLYRRALRVHSKFDPAAVCEEVFASHGWEKAWRNGIYDFLHFHTGTHEVLGIARGRVNVEFGGAKGRTLSLRAGDVVVLPAGTGHRRISASKNLLVVGAYPSTGRYDEPRPGEVSHDVAKRRISRVVLPSKDPLYGNEGGLFDFWMASRKRKAPKHSS
jgi:uncharacterized protein YjlB